MFRLEQTVLACSLAAVGLSVVALRLLADPASWASRLVDRKILPAGTEL